MAQKTLLWQTWDNRLVDIQNMSHQHMSNIHYYQNLIYPKIYPKSQKNWIRTRLMENFGKILPYRPDPQFIFERGMLSKLGYLVNNVDIVVHGNKIGSYA